VSEQFVAEEGMRIRAGEVDGFLRIKGEVKERGDFAASVGDEFVEAAQQEAPLAGLGEATIGKEGLAGGAEQADAVGGGGKRRGDIDEGDQAVIGTGGELGSTNEQGNVEGTLGGVVWKGEIGGGEDDDGGRRDLAAVPGGDVEETRLPGGSMRVEAGFQGGADG
jgi:hypothetical protein